MAAGLGSGVMEIAWADLRNEEGMTEVIPDTSLNYIWGAYITPE
jgi:hypothetical protein